MHQQTLPEVPFERYRNPTRREHFFEEMNRVVPWVDLVAVIELAYPRPRASEGRRRAYAASPLFTAVVQPLRSGHRRSAV